MNIEKRLKELDIALPEVSPPRAMYVPVKRVGNLLFVSGHLPVKEDGTIYTGKLGKEHNAEYGQAAARRCIISMLATLKAELGSLDVIKGFVKLQSFVSCEVGFENQPLVTNGASELLVEIFGEIGRHTRTAVGTNQLPFDATIEIDAIIEI
ncbi:MAG: RidA family protein [Oscillospiraceae bacterium]|nr:RidA family protein [Oscillospiraceae bacterium]